MVGGIFFTCARPLQALCMVLAAGQLLQRSLGSDPECQGRCCSKKVKQQFGFWEPPRRVDRWRWDFQLFCCLQRVIVFWCSNDNAFSSDVLCGMALIMFVIRSGLWVKSRNLARLGFKPFQHPLPMQDLQVDHTSVQKPVQGLRDQIPYMKSHNSASHFPLQGLRDWLFEMGFHSSHQDGYLFCQDWLVFPQTDRFLSWITCFSAVCDTRSRSIHSKPCSSANRGPEFSSVSTECPLWWASSPVTGTLCFQHVVWPCAGPSNVNTPLARLPPFPRLCKRS